MKKGLLIAFPTDTVYGIGTPYDDKEGLLRINALKGRSDIQRMAVLCDSLDMAERLAILDKKAKKIINAFLPGILTIIVPANNDYFQKTGEDTVGIRIPNHQVALTIIKQYGPLKTTSINKHGEKPLNDYKTIKSLFSDQIDIIFPNDQAVSSGISSTVITYSDNEIAVLREGTITLKDIKKVLDE